MLAFLLPQCGTARGENVRIEAEDFNAYHDISAYPIGTYTYLSYVTLQGLDYPGEWTEYTAPVTAYGRYAVTMLCWGDTGIAYRLRLYITPESGGGTQTIDFEFLGKGCFL